MRGLIKARVRLVIGGGANNGGQLSKGEKRGDTALTTRCHLGQLGGHFPEEICLRVRGKRRRRREEEEEKRASRRSVGMQNGRWPLDSKQATEQWARARHTLPTRECTEFHQFPL